MEHAANLETPMAAAVTVRCGHPRMDGTRCKRTWFTVWVRPNDPALLVLPKGGEWKGTPPRREGVWFEGLMMGDDGFLQERPRWRVFCSKQCSTQHTVTKDTLEARASAAVSEGRRTIFLADLTTG
jgi:hypothetical protein